MKKIKIYFENHPKLKRIVKLFGVVTIVFSFLFNVFIGIALIINANNKIASLPDNQVRRAPVVNQDYSLFSCDDIVTKDFINALLDYEDQRSGFSDYISIGELLLDGVGAYQDCRAGVNGQNATGIFGWYLGFSDYNPNAFANFYDEAKAVKVIRVEVLTKVYDLPINNGSVNYYREWTMKLGLRNASDNEIGAFNFSVASYYDASYNLVRYLIIGSSGRYIMVNDWVITHLGNINLLLNLYYNSQPSFRVGYEQGFNAGVDSVNTQNNGVFGLIAQAFNSVASVFNITLIPGITIGTLIAVPLVVMVVIVLFKMFRG